VLTKVRGRGVLTTCDPRCDGLVRLALPDPAVGLAANRGSVAAGPSIGPAKAIRRSVGRGVAATGCGGVDAAGAPTAGGVGRADVIVADQPLRA